jgi:putative FmdB family regulatory protein
MPLYEYLCDSCGVRFETLQRGDNAPCECGLNARRRWSFRPAAPTFEGGYNPAVGRYVSNLGDLKSAFGQASEEQSRLTGMDVDIQPVDLGDKAACGITDADIDRMTEEKAKAAS